MVGGDTLTEKREKKKKRSNLISPPGTPRVAGARNRRGNVEVAAAPSNWRGETQPRVVQGSSYCSPQNTRLRGV